MTRLHLGLALLGTLALAALGAPLVAEALEVGTTIYQ